MGSHLLETLLNQGQNVVILKRSTSDLWRIQHLLDRVKSYDVDIEPIENAFRQQQIDAVIHTACHYGRNADSLQKIYGSNMVFGLSLIEVAIESNTKTFINTDTLLNKHLNFYTLSKKQFVECLEKLSEKIQIINLKLEHMYGPKDDETKFISWIVNQLARQVECISLTKGEQLRDFVYVDDVVSAYLTVLENSNTLPKFCEYDVGTGSLTSIKEFVCELVTSYEKKYGKCKTSLGFGLIPYREAETMSVVVNNAPLIELGWIAKTTLSDGISRSLGQ